MLDSDPLLILNNFLSRRSIRIISTFIPCCEERCIRVPDLDWVKFKVTPDEE